VITVDKSKRPDGVDARCTTLTENLRKVYQSLIERYGKKRPDQPVVLTDEDRNLLILSALGKSPTSEKERSALLKQVPPFTFGEELVEAIEPTSLPRTEQDFGQLRDPWLKHFFELLQQYNEIRGGVRTLWTAALQPIFPNLDDPTRARFGEQVARSYQRYALDSSQPFGTWKQALTPNWFQPHQIEAWETATDFDTPLAAKDAVGIFARYQSILHTARVGILDGPAPWLVPTVWMVPDGKTEPNCDTLFSYVQRVHLQRLAEGRSPDPNLTQAELTDLRDLLRGRETELVYHFLGIRAFGQAVMPYLEAKKVTTRRPLIGFKSDAFDSAFYSGHGIKEALMTGHFGKCAFCEAKVAAIAHGDVEHFRPKAGYNQGHAFNHDGYFWRAYDWTNLYYSCQVCNQVYKGNHFPVLLDSKQTEVRQTHDRYDRPEKPVLIDPGVEDPRKHIRFDPRTGYAYAYDLLSHFLQRATTDPVPNLIWSDPSVIPDLSHSTGDTMVEDGPLHLTASGFTNLTYQVPGEILRGVRTIQILGLNRTELVTRRIQHLRALRGLFVVASGSTSPEQSDARQAIDAAVRPDAEFSSLAIDAIGTWRAEQTRVNENKAVGYQWLKRYNEILGKPPVYEYEESGFEDKDIPIMYLVEDMAKANTERRLVYLTAKDEIDDPKLPRGWYLQVPEADYNLTALVYRGGVAVDKLKVSGLFEDKQAWRKFKDTTVVVAGGFSTVVSL
jgi:hypothetical protein